MTDYMANRISRIYEDCRERWLRGDCPCCGLPLETRTKDSPAGARPVAEGVWFCGPCFSEGHHLLKGKGRLNEVSFLEEMLKALLPPQKVVPGE